MATKAKTTKSAKKSTAGKRTKGRAKSAAAPKSNAAPPPEGSKAARAIAALAKLTKHDLQKKYEEVFGHKTRSHNSNHLRNVIAARIAEQVAEKNEERKAAKNAGAGNASRENKFARDPRAPEVGTILEREYNGKLLKVKVLDDGFEYESEKYRSLSALALKITGTIHNGWVWFKLVKHPSAVKKAASDAS